MNETPPQSGLTRRHFLRNFGAAAAVAAATPIANAADEDPFPNVVLILADDLSYDNLSCQGSSVVHTPNIDSIAAAGVRFTNGYAASVCGPSRACLLTGYYPQEIGFEYNLEKKDTSALPPLGLSPLYKTLGDRLRSAGYATGIIGKWHLGTAEKYQPLQRGFDEFFGFLGGSRSYYQSSAKEPLYNDNEVVTEREYLTDAFARKAESFIERHHREPFFLYLPFNACHGPLDPPPPRYLRRYEKIADPAQRNVAGIISALDDGVGRVLTSIRRRGLEDNTVVIFLSDNGGTVRTRLGPTSLRGDKSSLFEGGIRVPMMMKWPGTIAPSTLYHNPVCAFDLHATLLRAARRPRWNIDRMGDCVDILPFLDPSATASPHDALYWRYDRASAIRQGDWKLIQFRSERQRILRSLLFNLAEDQRESADLALQEPARAAQMSDTLFAWWRRLPVPKWHPDKTPLERGREDEDDEDDEREG